MRLWGWEKAALSHWLCLTFKTINQSFQHQGALFSACALINTYELLQPRYLHDIALVVTYRKTQDDPHPCTDEGTAGTCTHGHKCQLVKTARTLPATCFNEVCSISANIMVSFQGDLNVEDKAAFREIPNTQIHIEMILWAVRQEACGRVRLKC